MGLWRRLLCFSFLCPPPTISIRTFFLPPCFFLFLSATWTLFTTTQPTLVLPRYYLISFYLHPNRNILHLSFWGRDFFPLDFSRVDTCQCYILFSLPHISSSMRWLTLLLTIALYTNCDRVFSQRRVWSYTLLQNNNYNLNSNLTGLTNDRLQAQAPCPNTAF